MALSPWEVGQSWNTSLEIVYAWKSTNARGVIGDREFAGKNTKVTGYRIAKVFDFVQHRTHGSPS